MQFADRPPLGDTVELLNSPILRYLTLPDGPCHPDILRRKLEPPDMSSQGAKIKAASFDKTVSSSRRINNA